jgi:hypothetical protein
MNEVSSREDKTKEFRDGRKIELDTGTTVQCYAIILLGGMCETEWVSCVIGKKIWPASTATIASNHKGALFRDWVSHEVTIKKIKNTADQYQNQLLPAPVHLPTNQQGIL